MRNCTLIEVLRCVRRVVTCAERNTYIASAPEKSATQDRRVKRHGADTISVAHDSTAVSASMKKPIYFFTSPAFSVAANGSGANFPRWHVPQVTGIPEPSTFAM